MLSTKMKTFLFILTGLIFHGILTVPLVCSLQWVDDPIYTECLKHYKNFTIEDHHLILETTGLPDGSPATQTSCLLKTDFPLYFRGDNVWTWNFTKDSMYVSQYLLLNKTKNKHVIMSYNDIFDNIPHHCYSQQCLIYSDYNIIISIISANLLAVMISFLTLTQRVF